MDQVRSDIALLHRRVGMGATAAELDALTPGGYDAAVDGLLAGLAGPDPGGDAVAVPALTLEAAPAGPAGSPARKAQQADLRSQVESLQAWWSARMAATSTPAREWLVLHWHGHFATAVSKVRDAALMYQQNQLFRTAGAGGFEALTQAVAKGAAMMRWLDTATDVAAHPNENFARECLELFTMGVGTYSQADVTAAARAFTGWATVRPTGAWRLRPRLHDAGTKTFLGHRGDWGGEDIIHMAVTTETSARFVLAGLWGHLAHPVSPDDQVVTDLLPAYGPGLDVGAALAAAVRHPAFRSARSRTGLVKQPLQWLVGAVRALGLDPGAVRPPLARTATVLGQAPFDPPNVGGWGQGSYWLDTATSLARLHAAATLAAQADLSTVADASPGDRLDAAAHLLAIDGWGPTTAAGLAHASGDPVALVAAALCTPEAVLA